MQKVVAAFVRRLRRDFFRGRGFKYAYSFEEHPGGHGWHVNFYLPSIFLDKRSFERCWGQGNVWYVDFTKDTHDSFGRPLGNKASRAGGSDAHARTARRSAKAAAAYGAKYAGKAWAALDLPRGAHRYECAEGFAPPVIRERFDTFHDAEVWLSKHASFGRLEYEWASEEMADWPGPPVRAYHFAPPYTSTKRVKGRSAAESERLVSGP